MPRRKMHLCFSTFGSPQMSTLENFNPSLSKVSRAIIAIDLPTKKEIRVFYIPSTCYDENRGLRKSYVNIKLPRVGLRQGGLQKLIYVSNKLAYR